MYGPPGRAYVYFIYGNYFCVNAVCAPAKSPEAVLIRAIEPRFNIEWMKENRPVSTARALTSGPSKLCMALAIERELDGADLSSHGSGLIIAANPEAGQFTRDRGPVITTARVGLSVAADWPLRFYLDQSEFISKRARGREPAKPQANSSLMGLPKPSRVT